MENKKRVNGIISIPASLKGTFFRYWLEFLAPFHKLTAREIDIAASYIKQRYLLSRAIKDEDLLDRVTMSEETKRIIMKECNITSSHLQVVMGKLKKAKILIDGRINPKFIPKNLSDEDKSFQLLLYFDLDAESN